MCAAYNSRIMMFVSGHSKLQGLDTAHPRPAKWWGLLVMPFGAFLSILWIAGIDRHGLPALLACMIGNALSRDGMCAAAEAAVGAIAASSVYAVSTSCRSQCCQVQTAGRRQHLQAATGALCVVCRATDPSIDMKILIPSFGASAVLLFAVPESKLSQPRNFVGESGACSKRHHYAVSATDIAQNTIAPLCSWQSLRISYRSLAAFASAQRLHTAGGQFFSAVVGCVCRDIFPDSVNWVAAPVGVGISVLVMQITRTVHPPGRPPTLPVDGLRYAMPLSRWLALCLQCQRDCAGSLGRACLSHHAMPGAALPRTDC